MKGSETLWNEDELLTQMEQMQDQIDQMGREKDELVRVIGEKDTLLTKNNWLLIPHLAEMRTFESIVHAHDHTSFAKRDTEHH